MALDRRGFMKFVAGGTAGIMASPLPWKLLDDVSIWTQNWPWIPRNIDGTTEFVHTVSKLCPSAVGMKVRTVSGRPVRAVGDPDHPLSLGGISAVAAAEVQMLYSPARMKRPLRRAADGAYVAITWDEALAMLEEQLSAVKGSGDKLACLSGDDNGTINEVLSGLLAKAGSSNFFLMPGEAQPAQRAWELMGGQGQPGYDFENSDYVLGIGANILESWGPAIRHRHFFSVAHPHGEEPAVRYVYAGPVQNNTAAGADQWLPIKPGTEAVFALGLAHLLIKKGAVANVPDFGDFRAYTAEFTPAKVASLTGVDPKALSRVADELAAASRPLVVTGSEFDQGAGAATVMAGFAVNLLLGAASVKALPVADSAVQGAMSRARMLRQDFIAYLSRINAGKAPAPQVLIVHEANPAYALPQADDMAKVMEKIPFKVSFSTFLDETAMMCDLVLPVPMGIERQDDVNTPYGCGQVTYCMAQQVIEPLVDARPAGDVLLSTAARLGMDLGHRSFESVLKAKAAAIGANYRKVSAGTPYVSKAALPLTGLALRPDVLKQTVSLSSPAEPFAIAPVHKLNIGTSNTATPPFNTKTIRRWELQGDEFYVMMNAATARKLGVKQHDAVSLSNKDGSIRARVNIFEGVMTDTVAVLLGFGHTAFDEFSKGKGANVMHLLTAGFEPVTGLSVWNRAGVNIAKA